MLCLECPANSVLQGMEVNAAIRSTNRIPQNKNLVPVTFKSFFDLPLEIDALQPALAGSSWLQFV